LNWNTWVRQIHRWLSIIFTVTVIANFAAMALGNLLRGWFTRHCLHLPCSCSPVCTCSRYPIRPTGVARERRSGHELGASGNAQAYKCKDWGQILGQISGSVIRHCLPRQRPATSSPIHNELLRHENLKSCSRRNRCVDCFYQPLSRLRCIQRRVRCRKKPNPQ
jgi:hypothetical protein